MGTKAVFHPLEPNNPQSNLYLRGNSTVVYIESDLGGYYPTHWRFLYCERCAAKRLSSQSWLGNWHCDTCNLCMPLPAPPAWKEEGVEHGP